MEPGSYSKSGTNMTKSTYPVFNHNPRIVEEGQTRAEQVLILEAVQLRERVKELEKALRRMADISDMLDNDERTDMYDPGCKIWARNIAE